MAQLAGPSIKGESLYALGFLPILLCHAAVMGHAQHSFTVAHGLPASDVGFAWSAFAFLTAVASPLAGHLGDTVGRAKMVRRAFVPWCISTLVVFSTPRDAMAAMLGGPALFVAIALTVQGWLQTTMLINYLGLYADVYEGNAARGAGAKQFFSIAGMLAGMSFPPVISGGWESPTRVGWVLAGASAVLLAPACLVPLATLERRWSSAKKCGRSGGAGSSGNGGDGEAPGATGFVASACVALRSASLQALLVAVALSNLGNGLLSSAFQAFTRYVSRVRGPAALPAVLGGAELPESAQVSIILSSFYVAGLLGAPVWSLAARRCGPRVAWAIESFAYAALLGATAAAPGVGFARAFAGTAVLGFAMGGFMTLPDIVLGDIAARSGAGAGMCFGLRGVVVKLSSALQGFISGTVLAGAGYAPKVSEPGPDAISALWLLTIFLPMAFFAASAVGILFIPQPPPASPYEEVSEVAGTTAKETKKEK